VSLFLSLAADAVCRNVSCRGGGIAGQATAVRHAISRALIEYPRNLRGALKKEGFLKRDPRAKERRKPGLSKPASASSGPSANAAGAWMRRSGE
jgi:ribosomal protein S9